MQVRRGGLQSALGHVRRLRRWPTRHTGRGRDPYPCAAEPIPKHAGMGFVWVGCGRCQVTRDARYVVVYLLPNICLERGAIFRCIQMQKVANNGIW
jgi:hypothetical protein